MSYFIDKSYFESSTTSVPQLGQLLQVRALNSLIDEHELPFLESLFGYTFYKLFMDAVIEDGAGTALEERFVKLRDGDEYNDAAGIKRKWKGLCNDELRSPIANYVYFHFLRGNAVVTTVQGEKATKSTTTVNMGAYPKQVAAWNEMVKMNHSLVEFLLLRKNDDGTLVYPEFKLEDVNVSAYNNLMTKIIEI